MLDTTCMSGFLLASRKCCYLQARQRAAIFSAWSCIIKSRYRAGAQHYHQTFASHSPCLDPGLHCWTLTAPGVQLVDTADLAVQRAFQGWRAVVLHITARRVQQQEAALASAERAIHRGCHAAFETAPAVQVHLHPACNTHAPQLSLPSEPNNTAECTAYEAEQHVDEASCQSSKLLLEHSAVTPQPCDTAQDAAEITAAYFKASAHWSERLQTHALHAWREMSRQSIASLWQQHELKSLVNQQLLQVHGYLFMHAPRSTLIACCHAVCRSVNMTCCLLLA